MAKWDGGDRGDGLDWKHGPGGQCAGSLWSVRRGRRGGAKEGQARVG